MKVCSCNSAAMWAQKTYPKSNQVISMMQKINLYLSTRFLYTHPFFPNYIYTSTPSQLSNFLLTGDLISMMLFFHANGSLPQSTLNIKIHKSQPQGSQFRWYAGRGVSSSYMARFEGHCAR